MRNPLWVSRFVCDCFSSLRKGDTLIALSCKSSKIQINHVFHRMRRFT